MDSTLRSLAFSFVFVIIDAINIHDSLVSRTSWSLYRHVIAWSHKISLTSTV